MSLFFGFRGRIGRAKFWLLQLFLGTVIFSTLFYLLELRDPDLLHVRAIGVYGLSALWSFLLMSIIVRRLHDLGKSGWWYVPYFLIPKTMLGFAKVYPEIEIPIAILVVIGVIGIWGAVEMGFIRGTKGANKYDFGPVLVNA